MSMFKFASLAHPDKYAYAFDTSAWERTNRSSSNTHRYYRQFETYGDGLTQHSNDWSVTWEYLPDFLASLAVAMMDNPELTGEVAYSLRQGEGSHRIEFAAGVVWKESDESYSKRRYFSLSLLKMGNKTKEYDKRFTAIEKWHDGTRASIYRMLVSDYSSEFEKYQVAESVTAWADAQSKYVPVGENFPDFGLDYDRRYALRNVLQCCRYIVESRERREWAQSSIDNYKRQLERAAEDAAAAAKSDVA